MHRHKYKRRQQSQPLTKATSWALQRLPRRGLNQSLCTRSIRQPRNWLERLWLDSASVCICFFSSFIRKTSLLSSQKQTNTWEPLRVRNSPNSFRFNAMISVAVLLGVRIELRIQSRMKMRRHEHGQMTCQWLKSFWPPCLLLTSNIGFALSTVFPVATKLQIKVAWFS